MKRVLLDCDGVMADFIQGYLNVVEWETGRKFRHEDVTEWNMADALMLTKEEGREVASHIDYDFCRNLKPIKGAVKGMDDLCQVADVYVVTSPWNSCKGWTHAREAWLLEHMGINHKRVLHGSAKVLVDGDIFVDDRVENVIEWAAAHPNGTAVLWDQPWNRNSEWYGIRTNSWNVLFKLATENL